MKLLQAGCLSDQDDGEVRTALNRFSKTLYLRLDFIALGFLEDRSGAGGC